MIIELKLGSTGQSAPLVRNKVLRHPTEQKQVDLCEFQISLVYIVTSRAT